MSERPTPNALAAQIAMLQAQQAELENLERERAEQEAARVAIEDKNRAVRALARVPAANGDTVDLTEPAAEAPRGRGNFNLGADQKKRREVEQAVLLLYKIGCISTSVYVETPFLKDGEQYTEHVVQNNTPGLELSKATQAAKQKQSHRTRNPRPGPHPRRAAARFTFAHMPAAKILKT